MIKPGWYENEALKVRIVDRGLPGGTITQAHSKPEPGYSVVYDPDTHIVVVSGPDGSSRNYSDHDFIDLITSIRDERGVIRKGGAKTAAAWLEIGEMMIAVAILTLRGQEVLQDNDIRRYPAN